MKDYTNLCRNVLEQMITKIKTVKTTKKITYLNVESAFDIETSSVTVGGEKSAFMYIWLFGIGYENEVYYGRTWEEFLELCKLLQNVFELGKDKRLVVYVHNLSYEFQFMCKYFDWYEVFAVAERKPVKALCTYGIEFRDSYILSGLSLAKTAENLTSHTIEKMVGDLDYSLVRTPHTPLTEKEMKYCENDIRVVNAYIAEQIDEYKDVSKIPMTNTGRVRTYVRNECYYTSKTHRKTSRGKYHRYRKIMDDLTLDSRTYQQLKRAFGGGYTHANSKYVGTIQENVFSLDFTSSYPAVMLSEQFPMSRGKLIEVKSLQQLNFYCRKYCLVFEAKFTNIRSKITQDNYISESKCYHSKGVVVNNGRIFKADEIALTITNVDYDIISMTYEWDNLEVANVTRFHKAYLPKSIIESVIKLYEDKTVLKDVAGKEVEYMKSKGMLNSTYGMCVTDIVQDETIYAGAGWSVQQSDVEEQIQKYNESKNRFLYYAWGIFITAYSRKNLWTGILAMGDDYIYSDTDSIKALNYEKHLPYIEWYNKDVNRKLHEMCDTYGIDKDKLSPVNQKGVAKPIGVWDFEGIYTRFKTLGAKRYLVQQGDKYQLTVAGLSKQKGMDYIKRQANNDSDKIFDMFNDELYIPATDTGKMTHTYIDDTMEYMIVDYLGDECWIETKSGIHLEPCEFTLSLSKQYITFLKNFVQGYVYGGLDHV